MKYKTLFRLALKAIGVLLMAEALSSFVYSLTNVAWQLTAAQGSPGFPSGWFMNWMILPLSHILKGAVGGCLFLRGEWIVNLAIPSNRPYCPECAYDLTGAVEPRCPECGTPFRWEDVKPKGETSTPETK